MKKEKRKDADKQTDAVKNFNNIPIVERRRFIRHPLSLPLSYEVIKPGLKKGQEDRRSETINVSMGGLLFSSKYSAQPGSLITIKMPFEDKVFNVKAKVVRCTTNPETKFYDIAVSFFRLYEAFKIKMIEQIYLILEYRDLLSVQLGREISLEEASEKWVKRYSERFKRLYW
ncbi:MAG: PilZ domain-containing protein [Candidatus Omnitrophica bacterium]|nr:PilZ domain-containing protein [Candidatus Omnitrophota bacterium]